MEIAFFSDWVNGRFSLVQVSWANVKNRLTNEEGMIFIFCVLGLGIEILFKRSEK